MSRTSLQSPSQCLCNGGRFDITVVFTENVIEFEKIEPGLISKLFVKSQITPRLLKSDFQKIEQ